MEKWLPALTALALALVALVLPASAAAVTTGQITRAVTDPGRSFGSVAGSVTSDYCDRSGGCDEAHYWNVSIEVSIPGTACPNGDAPPPPGVPPVSMRVFESDPQTASGTLAFDTDVALLGSPAEQVCVYASSVEIPCFDPTDPMCFPTAAQLFSISAPFVVGDGTSCPPVGCDPPPCPPGGCDEPGCVSNCSPECAPADCLPPECPPACPDPCAAGCPDPGTDFSLFSLMSSQQVRKLLVKLALAERGVVTVSGTVHVLKPAKTYNLKPVSVNAMPGTTLKIRIPVRSKVRRAVARALRRGRRAHAKLTITAKDAASNTRTEKRTVRLRR